jgi:hypothetical protein
MALNCSYRGALFSSGLFCVASFYFWRFVEWQEARNLLAFFSEFEKRVEERGKNMIKI